MPYEEDCAAQTLPGDLLAAIFAQLAPEDRCSWQQRAVHPKAHLHRRCSSDANNHTIIAYHVLHLTRGGGVPLLEVPAGGARSMQQHMHVAVARAKLLAYFGDSLVQGCNRSGVQGVGRRAR